jgi:hypothetical protein
VDVVADGGAVFGGVVVAEDSEVRTTAHGHLCQEGEQVVGDAEGVFAERAARVGACRVEVAQTGGFPGWVCGAVVADDFFDGDFCAAVRVGGSQWTDLWKISILSEELGRQGGWEREGVPGMGIMFSKRVASP